MRPRLEIGALVVGFVVAGAVAGHADSVVGTLTVKGTPTPLRWAWVSLQSDPADPESPYLVILASDVPVAEADRSPARLTALAAAGSLKAVRMLWKEGSATVLATPYYASLPQSGRRGSEHPTLDLQRYDGKRFEGIIKSKMLGQEWFFQANVKGTLKREGAVEVEPEAAEAAAQGATSAPAGDATSKKMALGKLGYEYNDEMFRKAVMDSNVEAVRLFLGAGMSPNTQASSSEQPLALAVTMCGYGHEAEALEMAKALLAAGAKVDAGAENGVTPLLSAAQYCKGVDIIKLLLGAGANVNTRAPGGATPLMFAKIFQKTEMEQVLRQAGARD